MQAMDMQARRGARALGFVLGVAVCVRVALFPLAENKQGDAPMRALIAERMNADPAAAADPRAFCQFGPLHIEVMRPFLAVDADARRSSRILSLIAGIALFLPFAALARRLLGRPPGEGGQAATPVALASLALALSPLHLQASTTAASEALYLFFLCAALERLHLAVSEKRRRVLVVAASLASLAAVIRYDTWIAVPAAAAALFWLGGRDRRALADAALFAGVASALPLAYLGWSWATTGDPLFFAGHIARDHANLAGEVSARLGPVVARLRALSVWGIAFAAVMSPVLFFLAPFGLRGSRRRHSPATHVVMIAALAPPAVYLIQGLAFGSFEPLPRFALGPGMVLLPFGAQALVERIGGWRRQAPLVAGSAAVTAAAALVLAYGGSGRSWAGAEALAPLTRLDAEDRALAEHIAARRRPEEGVFIDTIGFADAVITHAARVPAPRSVSLAITRTFAGSLASMHARTGASWFAVHDDSWGAVPVPDWPEDSVRFGRWKLAKVTGGRGPGGSEAGLARRR
jgi:hypothetical protein